MKQAIIQVCISTLLLLLVSCTSVGTSDAKALGEKSFPSVGGMDLLGREQLFPDCLKKDKTIVIVAFQRWQQKLVDSWYPNIEKEMATQSDLAYYEVPTIAKLNPMVRWWIYNGMRGGIPDEKMRSQVITLHIDKSPFKKYLNITNENSIYIFLLDNKGRIQHREEGSFSAEKWQRLKEKTKQR